MLVDENQRIRTFFSSLLSMIGFQDIQAADGVEALDLISREHFRVVVSDFQMPGMDGFTLASNINSASPKTPATMITRSDQSLVHEKMRKGCVGSVLFKPFKLEDIHESVKDALSGGVASCATGQHFCPDDWQKRR